MIRKLATGEYRLFSRKPDPKTGKRRNLGTFATREQAEKHEREIQYFKRPAAEVVHTPGARRRAPAPSSRPGTPGAQGQHQRVPMPVRLERLDRRALVDHPRVVEQQAGPRLVHREAQAGRAVGVEDARLAALDAFAADQDHGDEVDAVAVRAFGRRPADAVGGVDAELVRLDVPGLRAAAARRGERGRTPAGRRAMPARRRRPARSARTSARGRRAARCIRPAASARDAATSSTASPRRRRSRSGGGGGSGRRRAGRCRAAGRPTTAAARRARPARAPRQRAKPAGVEHGMAVARRAPRRRRPGGVDRRGERRASPAWRSAPARRPCASAASLASATSRRIGARPQLVQAISRSAGTNCSARPIVSAISSGVSITSEATSITPTITSLPSSRRISSGGTCEWKHSSETWSIAALGERREDLLVLAPLARRASPSSRRWP